MISIDFRVRVMCVSECVYVYLSVGDCRALKSVRSSGTGKGSCKLLTRVLRTEFRILEEQQVLLTVISPDPKGAWRPTSILYLTATKKVKMCM